MVYNLAYGLMVNKNTIIVCLQISIKSCHIIIILNVPSKTPRHRSAALQRRNAIERRHLAHNIPSEHPHPYPFV
jgi:hypothetical protein